MCVRSTKVGFFIQCFLNLIMFFLKNAVTFIQLIIWLMVRSCQPSFAFCLSTFKIVQPLVGMLLFLQPLLVLHDSRNKYLRFRYRWGCYTCPRSQALRLSKDLPCSETFSASAQNRFRNCIQTVFHFSTGIFPNSSEPYNETPFVVFCNHRQIYASTSPVS